MEQLPDETRVPIEPDENGLKPYHVQELNQAHKTAVVLHTLAGFKKKEIAEMLGRSLSWVNTALDHPHAAMMAQQLQTDLVSELTENAASVFAGAAHEAAMTLVELMRYAQSESVRLSAAIEIKNTAGFKPTERVFNFNANAHVDKGTAELMLQAVRESRQPVSEYKPVDDSAAALGIERDEDVLERLPVARRTAPPARRNGAD